MPAYAAMRAGFARALAGRARADAAVSNGRARLERPAIEFYRALGATVMPTGASSASSDRRSTLAAARARDTGRLSRHLPSIGPRPHSRVRRSPALRDRRQQPPYLAGGGRSHRMTTIRPSFITDLEGDVVDHGEVVRDEDVEQELVCRS